MNSSKQTALGLVALTIVSSAYFGCTYPDFKFDAEPTVAGVDSPDAGTSTGSRTVDPTDPGPVGGTRTTGAGAGAGGFGGEGGGGGGGASTGGTGGVIACKSITHPGGGTCEYLPGQQCGCASTQKCGVTDENSGEANCLNAGSLAQGQKCTSNSACRQDFWCEHLTGTCEKICTISSQCNGGLCVGPPRATGGTMPIPGLKVCSANCEPITAAPCGTGTTCAFDASIQAFDCFTSGLKKETDACTRSVDCDKGLVCVLRSGVGDCEGWCSPVNTVFPGTKNNCTSAKPNCIGFSTPFKRNGIEYGTCEK